MKIGFLAALFLYFVLLMGAGVLFSRKNKTLEDFFLASRTLSPTTMALSLCAAWFGANSILVSADEACRTGVSAYWIIGLPAILTILFYVFFFGSRIHDLPALSLSDLVEERYGRAVRHLATALIVWYMIMLAGSQMVAVGQFLKVFLGTSYLLNLIVATSVVFLYSILGGLRSVARADSLQFFLLAGGVLGLFLSLMGRTSFQESGSLALHLGKAGYFDFFHDFEKNALIAVSFTLAWTVSPVAWQRIQAVRTVKEARHGLLASAGLLATLYALIVAAGILFEPLFGAVTADPGTLLLSRFITTSAGPFLGAILFVAVMAAIISTMDAALNTGALYLTRDVFQQIFPRSSSPRLMVVSRLMTFLAGGAALAVAYRFQGDILKTLGLASLIMAEGLFVPGMAMLFLKKKRPLAGLLALVLGGGFSLVSFLNDGGVIPMPLPPWPYSVPYGVALCAAGFFSGWGIMKFRESRGKEKKA